MRPLRGTGPALVTLLVVAALACDPSDESDDDNFRADVIACEDAVARLATCCPDFEPASVECNYAYRYESGCGTFTNETTYPSLSKADSACIRDTGCAALVAEGVCERAAAAVSPFARDEGDGERQGEWGRGPIPAPSREAVCR